MAKTGLFLFVVLTASVSARTDDLRQCEPVELEAGERTALVSVRDATQAKTVIPFSVKVLEKGEDGATINVHLASSEDRDSDVYVISMGEDMLVSKVEGDATPVLEKVKMVRMDADSGWKGFFVRVKTKQESTLVSVFEGGEEGSDALMSARDADQERVTHVAFSVSGTSGGRVLIEHSCKVLLNGSCLHSVECVEAFSTCSNKGDKATCICDEEHMLSPDGDSCIHSSLRVGDACENSLECAHLAARCRPASDSASDSASATDANRVCACHRTSSVDDRGVCVEKPDKGQLELRRLGKAPTWSDSNPGRVLTVPKQPRPLVSHCQISLRLSFGLPSQLFPLSLTPEGFSVGLFLRGEGDVSLQVAHVDPASSKRVPLFDVAVESTSGVVSLASADGQSAKTTLETPIMSHGGANTCWLSLRCVSSKSERCALQLGIAESPLLNVSVSNPWLDGAQPPTHFRLESLSRDADVTALSLCSVQAGETCTHDGDCRAASADLQCRKDNEKAAKCRCRRDKPVWSEKQAKCVQAT